jgi:hypothetical protein
MADQQNLHILEVEPQRLHILPDQRNAARQIAVDQDEPLWRSNQIRREVLASHVVHVTDHAKWLMICRPLRVDLRKRAAGEDKRQEKGTKEHGKEYPTAACSSSPTQVNQLTAQIPIIPANRMN